MCVNMRLLRKKLISKTPLQNSILIFWYKKQGAITSCFYKYFYIFFIFSEKLKYTYTFLSLSISILLINLYKYILSIESILKKLSINLSNFSSSTLFLILFLISVSINSFSSFSFCFIRFFLSNIIFPRNSTIIFFL